MHRWSLESGGSAVLICRFAVVAGVGSFLLLYLYSVSRRIATFSSSVNS